MEAVSDVEVIIALGQSAINWKVCIAPIHDEVLIGLDLLNALDAVVLTRQGDILVKGELVVGNLNSSVDVHVTRVSIPSDTTLPPLSETVLSAHVDKPNGKLVGVLDPASLKNGAHTGSVLVKMNECIPVRILNPTPQELKLPAGTHLSKLVEAEAEALNINTEESTDGNEGLLGKDSLNHIPAHLDTLVETSIKDHSKAEAEEIQTLLMKYSDVFAKNSSDVGRFSKITHQIVTGNAPPVRQRVRRTPLGFQGEEEQHLQSLLDAGIVVPSTSDWASPVVLVRKKDGGVRWCIDYRKLNDVTRKDSYPLPNIEECLDTLAGSTIFSTIDLQQGYHQIEMDPEDRRKTAFITRYGLFEYTRMPFGLCGAPGTFQRAMECVLKGLQWKMVLIYLDDVIVASRNLHEHIVHLEEVLQRFRESNLKLKPSKCSFFQASVLFLGHRICKDGIEANPDLTQIVQDWPVPQGVKDVQAFLGLSNYYRRFIEKYSDIAEPLYQLTKKGTVFRWGSEQQESFSILKERLVSPPILAYPLAQNTFILDTDASNHSIGAVLSQLQGNFERVISYASKRLGPAQTRYCVTRKELLAIVTFTQKFQHYLLGRQFIVRTDHGSLTWLYRFKTPQGQLARWLEHLSQFNIVFQHRKGTHHGNADALSRYPSEIPTCDCYRVGSDLSDLPCGGCKHCAKVQKEWSRFHSDVDDVVPLGVKKDCHLELMPNKQFHQGTLSDPVPNHLDSDPCFEGHSVHRQEAETTSDKASKQIREITQAEDSEQEDDDYQPISLNAYTSEELGQKQRYDPDLRKLIRWVADGFPKEREELFAESQALRHFWKVRHNLLLDGNCLYYQWEFPEETRKLFIVPDAMKKEIMEIAHCSPLAGHPGIKRTIQRLRRTFYWHNMTDWVTTYVQACEKCALSKKANKTSRSSLQQYRAGSPMDRVQLDILGPFPLSKRGNKYILVLVDQFSKWTECYPLPDQTSESIANALVKDFIAHFGVPLELHTDQGRNFDGDLMKRLSDMLGWAKTRTTPYPPSSNGLVERFNRTLLQMMRCFVSQNQDDWDEHIPLLAGGAYRSTPHTSTGLTPNRLMLGREVYLPEEVMFGLHPVEHDKSNYIESLRSSMKKCEEIARENLKSAAMGQKRLHDLRVCERSYASGDLVYIMDDAKRVGKSPKLQPLWKGPAIVARKLGPVLYEVIKKKGSTVLHHNRLKPCLLETLPRWVSKARRQLQYVAQYEKEDKRTHVSVDDKVQDVESAEETINEETTCGNQEMPGDRELSALEEAISPGLESKDTAEEEQIRNPVKMSRYGRKVQPPSRYTT